MAPLGRLTVHSSLIIAQEPCKICQFVVAISLGSGISEIRCFFKQSLRRLRRLWHGATCQSEFDQALEVKHDSHHEGLDTDLGQPPIASFV